MKKICSGPVRSGNEPLELDPTARLPCEPAEHVLGRFDPEFEFDDAVGLERSFRLDGVDGVGDRLAEFSEDGVTPLVGLGTARIDDQNAVGRSLVDQRDRNTGANAFRERFLAPRGERRIGEDVLRDL